MHTVDLAEFARELVAGRPVMARAVPGGGVSCARTSAATEFVWSVVQEFWVVVFCSKTKASVVVFLDTWKCASDICFRDMPMYPQGGVGGGSCQ